MIEALLSAVSVWASQHPEILAVGLAGSQARGTPRPDSDVDLILVVSAPGRFFATVEWIHRFGNVRAYQDEDWGRLRSRRVLYASGLKVEFGFVSEDWANTDPIDGGTKEVVAGGDFGASMIPRCA